MTWSRFKISVSHGVYDFILFKFFKRCTNLTSYIPPDALTLNCEHEMEMILFLGSLEELFIGRWSMGSCFDFLSDRVIYSLIFLYVHSFSFSF